MKRGLGRVRVAPEVLAAALFPEGTEVLEVARSWAYPWFEFFVRNDILPEVKEGEEAPLYGVEAGRIETHFVNPYIARHT